MSGFFFSRDPPPPPPNRSADASPPRPIRPCSRTGSPMVRAQAVKKEMEADLHSTLYKSRGPTFDKFIAKIEDKTGLTRENLFSIILTSMAGYLVFGGAGAQFLCNLIAVGYPAYASVKALKTPDKKDDTQWLVYWTVYASFTLIDFWAEIIMHYFPFYYLVKSLFFLYLYLPYTRGAGEMYMYYVEPTYEQISLYSNSFPSYTSLITASLSTAARSLTEMASTPQAAPGPPPPASRSRSFSAPSTATARSTGLPPPPTGRVSRSAWELEKEKSKESAGGTSWPYSK